MNGIFLYFSKIENTMLSGIDKKVLAQIKTYKAEKLKCELICCDEKKSLLNKITSRLPFGSIYPKWVYNKDMYLEINWIYFRRPTCLSKQFLQSISDFKEDHPDAKIIMEIPTYPYDGELKQNFIKNFPFYIKDKWNRRKLSAIIDRIVTLSDDDKIFNIPTIKIRNGVDLEKIHVRKARKKDHTINLCAVAMFTNSHAYDRLIQGMAYYYKNGGGRNILLHIVGEGPPLNKYHRLVAINCLQNHVVFHGFKSGKDLDKVYDMMDIGVAPLGLYRVGLSSGSFLKSHEYLAKGLPIITGCEIDILKGQKFKYVKQFSNDDSPLDIEQIIEFYDQIYNRDETCQEIIENIRFFANKTCGIENMVKPVVEYLNS